MSAAESPRAIRAVSAGPMWECWAGDCINYLDASVVHLIKLATKVRSKCAASRSCRKAGKTHTVIGNRRFACLNAWTVRLDA